MAGTAQERHSAGEAYRPGPGWDEACDAGGRPRERYSELMESLSRSDLGSLSRRVGADVRAAGARFGDGESGTFKVDPVPRVVTPSEWERVEGGATQRARALASFATDAYGDRRIVQAGRVPARVIDTADHFEPGLAGVEPAGAGYVAGLDLVRGADCELCVLEDNFRTPSGIAYMLAAREAVDAHLPVLQPPERLEPTATYGLLGDALRGAAPTGGGDPFVVLLSDGPRNSAWWEHGEIARALGVALVTPTELRSRAGALFADSDGHSRRIDVVYRRTDVDRLRDASGVLTWVAEMLLEPVRRGTVSVVNPLGCGVADDKLVHAYVEDMVRFYLDEEPILRSVPTHDLGDPETRAAALARIGELVIKPRSGLGGEGVVLGPRAGKDELSRLAGRVSQSPDDWVAQELVALSTHPTICDGRLAPRHVDLRVFAVGGPDGFRAVPGGLTRVAFDRGSMVVNSSQNGGAKDTWVIT